MYGTSADEIRLEKKAFSYTIENKTIKFKDNWYTKMSEPKICTL